MKSNWSIRQQRSQILANTMLFYPMKRTLILPQSTSMLLVSCLQPNVIICWFNLVVFMQMVQNIWISSWVFSSDFQTHLTSLKDPWKLEASPPDSCVLTWNAPKVRITLSFLLFLIYSSSLYQRGLVRLFPCILLCLVTKFDHLEDANVTVGQSLLYAHCRVYHDLLVFNKYTITHLHIQIFIGYQTF